MGYDRVFLIWGLVFLACGMALGIHMAATNVHIQHPTHAHINLLGGMVSIVYALAHKLWLDGPSRAIVARIQLYLHIGACLVLFTSLYMLFGNIYPAPKLDPFLSVGSFAAWAAMLLMLFMVLRYRKA